MGIRFWIKRFFAVLFFAFIIISGAQILKGNSLNYSILQGVIWSVSTAAVFVLGRIYQSRRGQQCATCQDTPQVKNNKF